MKVLYIVGGEGKRYGSEIIAINLITAGRANGVDYVVVTASKGAVSETCDKLNIENYVIPFRFFVYKSMSSYILNFIKKTIWKIRAEYYTRRAIRIIEKSIDIKSIDLIHTNLSRDLLGGILAKRNNIPHVWHIQELFKAHYGLSFLKNKQLEWMSEHADKFIAISKTVANEWVENGLPREKVEVVYNGINLSDIDNKVDYTDDNKLKLIMVGHIVPLKGQEKVIIALSKLSEEVKNNVIFDCYGDGEKDYLIKLKRLADDYNVNFTLKGYCSNIGGVLKDYDAGINYSKGEGFGLSTIEYMAAGICPIVVNTGANEELIKNNINGFVFEYDNHNEFSDLITRLYHDRKLINYVSNNARNDAISKYSIKKMEESIISIYESINNNGNGGDYETD